jgi:hypothetical protein
MFLSRRTLIRLSGMSMPSLAFMNLARKKPPAALPPARPGLQDRMLSVDVVKAWLAHHDVTIAKLDRLDGAPRNITSDVRASFRDDPVINAGGLLLPAGFCRYCLLAQGGGADEPNVI